MIGRKNKYEEEIPFGQGTFGMGINPMAGQNMPGMSSMNGIGATNAPDVPSLDESEMYGLNVPETNQSVPKMSQSTSEMIQNMPDMNQNAPEMSQPMTEQSVQPMMNQGFGQWGMTQEQMQMPQGQMPMMQGQMPMMQGQMPNMQGQMPMMQGQMPNMPYYTSAKEPKKGLIIGLIIGGAVVAMIVAIVGIVSFFRPEPEPEPEPESNPNPEVVDDDSDIPTMISANRFCLTNGLYVYKLGNASNDYERTNCHFYPADETDIVAKLAAGPEGDYATLDYFIFEKKFDEVNPFEDMNGDYSTLGVVLNDTDDYKVFYYVDDQYDYELFVYSVLYKKSYLLISGKTAEAVEKAIKTIGFPEWEHETPTAEDYKKYVEEENKKAVATPAKRDAIRKKDFDSFYMALKKYMNDNSGKENKLPGASIWTGTPNFAGSNDCAADNSACLFVRDYLNNVTNEDKNNTFVDPSGGYYNLLITPNLATDDDSGETTYNNNSKLVWRTNHYTISGADPFKEHVIFLVPGGTCDEDTVKKGKNDDFALLYRLEEFKDYCIDKTHTISAEP